MDILLVSATADEIQPVREIFQNKNGGQRFPVSEILLTGVGLVSTAYWLTRALSRRRPDLVIQVGIGGCFTDRKLAAVVTVKQESLADMGVREAGKFKTIFDLRLSDPDHPPFSRGALVNPFEDLLSFSAFDQVIGLSVNEITTEKSRAEQYRRQLEPEVESMEGAAFHFVCLQENIPFLQIRSLSNYIGERDRTKWKMKEAVHNLNEKLLELFDRLSAPTQSSVLLSRPLQKT